MKLLCTSSLALLVLTTAPILGMTKHADQVRWALGAGKPTRSDALATYLAEERTMYEELMEEVERDVSIAEFCLERPTIPCKEFLKGFLVRLELLEEHREQLWSYYRGQVRPLSRELVILRGEAMRAIGDYSNMPEDPSMEDDMILDPELEHILDLMERDGL